MRGGGGHYGQAPGRNDEQCAAAGDSRFGSGRPPTAKVMEIGCESRTAALLDRAVLYIGRTRAVGSVLDWRVFGRFEIRLALYLVRSSSPQGND